jgi:8-oxo-dGTP pyrophosphatase MutT (NUDIX family)
MKPVQLQALTKKVVVEDTKQSVQLSPERKNEIEAFWTKVNEARTFHRGEAFHVDSVTEENDVYRVKLKRTDYAHYLHSVKNQIEDEERCRVIFAAGLVETTDSAFVFGEMADHTAYPRRLQCVGGGLSWEDKRGNTFDMKENVLRELQEELGIEYSKHVAHCEPVYIKYGGTHDSIVILFHIKVNLTQEEHHSLYQDFVKNLRKEGSHPEFKHVIYLGNDKETIENFFETDQRHRNDYLESFLKAMAIEK